MSLDVMEVMAADVDIHRILCHWDQEETHREQYTRRPIPALSAGYHDEGTLGSRDRLRP